MIENEITINGVEFVAVDAENHNCEGCVFDDKVDECLYLVSSPCDAYKRKDHRFIIWKKKHNE